MTKIYYFLILVFCPVFLFAQNARLELATPSTNLPPGGGTVVVNCILLTAGDTQDTSFLNKNFNYTTLLSKKWRLDQMYVNEVAVAETEYAFVYLVLKYPATLVWVRKDAGVNKGKDYPVTFAFSPLGCTLQTITTYHKYNNTKMDIYQMAHISNSSMILTTTQKDEADPSYIHQIEYRFVPEL